MKGYWSGRPPSVGWWATRNEYNVPAWRWWDGEVWSAKVSNPAKRDPSTLSRTIDKFVEWKLPKEQK